MEIISKALFTIANALLVPDIVLLIFFFFRALVLLGATYSAFLTRWRVGRLLDGDIDALQPEALPQLRQKVQEAGAEGSRFTQYLGQLLSHEPDADYADYLVSRFEIETAKEVNLSRLLAKLGPVLGLIGTLISMSPALVGLSTGDIAGMAYNMQVVFSATVVGLLISAVGLFTLQLKQRWMTKDANSLDFVASVINKSKAV